MDDTSGYTAVALLLIVTGIILVIALKRFIVRRGTKRHARESQNGADQR
jgi:hypothetical protein